MMAALLTGCGSDKTEEKAVKEALEVVEYWNSVNLNLFSYSTPGGLEQGENGNKVFSVRMKPDVANAENPTLMEWTLISCVDTAIKGAYPDLEKCFVDVKDIDVYIYVMDLDNNVVYTYKNGVCLE